MLTPSQLSRSLLLLVVGIAAVGTAFGHAVTAVGIAAFVFVLAAIEGKPSWKRIWNPDPLRESGVLRFMSWKWPGAQRERVERRPRL